MSRRPRPPGGLRTKADGKGPWQGPNTIGRARQPLGRRPASVMRASAEVAFATITKDGDHALPGAHPARDLERRVYVRASRRAAKQPLFGGQPLHHTFGGDVADGHHLVDESGIEHVRDESRAEPLDAVAAKAAGVPVRSIISDNDPFTADFERTRAELEAGFSSSVRVESGAGHFNRGEEPAVLEELLSKLFREK